MKKIIIGLVVLIVAVVVAGVVVIKSTDINEYRDLIAEKAKEATGRELTLGGPLDLEVSFTPTVVARDVAFANAAWGSRPEMVKVKRFEAQLALMPLLTGTVQVNRVIIIDPDILIETDNKGVGNWVFDSNAKPAAKSEGGSGGGGAFPVVKLVTIENAKFTYIDGVAGKTTAIVLDKLSASADSASSPLKLALMGKFNGNAFDVSGELGSADAIMSGKALPVSIVAKAGGGTFGVKGTVDNPTAGKGLNIVLSAEGQNIADLAAIAGVKLHAIGPYKLSATLSDPSGGYALNGIASKIGSSDLGGNLSVNLSGSKPVIAATFSSNLMDAADFLPKAEKEEKAKPAAEAPKKAEGGKPAKVFPSDPLPLDALKSVTATVGYKAKKVKAPSVALNDLSVDISLKNGRLAIEPMNVGIGGGLLKTDVVLDGSKSTPSLSVMVKGASLGLGNMLKETGQSDLLEGGRTEVNITMAGRGKSVAEIMAGLNGQALITVGEGKINNSTIELAGADLLGQLFSPKEPFTPLKCGVVKASIKKGLVTIDKGVAVETANMNVVSDGDINLADETLNLSVNTSAKGGVGIGAGDLAKLVKLQGTLAEPSIGLDVLETGKAAMKIGSAIATGGLSLLTGALLDKVTTDQEPCQTALGLKSEQKSSTPASNSNQPAPQKKEEPADPVKGLTSGIKSLFGN